MRRWMGQSWRKVEEHFLAPEGNEAKFTCNVHSGVSFRVYFLFFVCIFQLPFIFSVRSDVSGHLSITLA